jgi:integrase
MSIQRKPNGRYIARWREADGRMRGKSFDRKRDAETFLATVTVDTMPDAGRETFAAFAAEWGAAQDWSPSTHVAFAAALKRITLRLGEGRRLDQIDELALANLRKSLVDTYARSTATITLHYAATVMRAAHRMRRIPRDVTQTLDPPKNRSGKSDAVTPDDIPTRAEVVAIMEAADDAWRAAISLGASGLRVSEVLGVHVEQYDHASGVLTIDRQLQRIDGVDSFKLPKRDKVRSIVLPDWARADLEQAIERQGSGLVFRGRLGEPRRRDVFYSSVWRPALVAAGLDERAYKFHSLRHWCASSMLAEGVPVTAVAGHLGDTIETLGRTYAHWLRDDREVPAAALSRMLRPTLAVVEAV